MGWFLLGSIVLGALFCGTFVAGFLVGISESDVRMGPGAAGQMSPAEPRQWLADLDRQTLDAMRERAMRADGARTDPGPAGK